jgi:Eukaryotic aspartyl protease
MDIGIGDQTFLVHVDTGSSDTYVFAANFTASSTFAQIANQNFNVTYGDGSSAAGILGTDTVTLAGVAVPGQEIGIAQANVSKTDP